MHPLDVLSPDSPPLNPSTDAVRRFGNDEVFDVGNSDRVIVVTEVRDPQTRECVFRKVLVPKGAADEIARERFVCPAEVVAASERKYVVHVCRLDENAGISFVVMKIFSDDVESALFLREALRIGRGDVGTVSADAVRGRRVEAA